MYKLSRYWNRFAYMIIDLGVWLIWDQTGRNKELLKDDVSSLEYTREILTTLPKKRQ